jgi:hypothetical protein
MRAKTQRLLTTYHVTTRETEGGEMEKSKKLWIPVLLGVLLIALMVGVAGAGVKNRASGALGPTAYITVPGAAFNPHDETADWYNYGQWIRNDSITEHTFYAGPIVFPHAGTVQITQVVLVALDENPTAEACARLFRNKFSTGAVEDMANVCSTGSDPAVRQFSTATISPARVNPKWNGFYVGLLTYPSNPPGSMVRVYAVRIAYKPVL